MPPSTSTDLSTLSNGNAGTIVAGTPVYASAAGLFDKAKGDTQAHATCIGIVVTDVATGARGTLRQAGILTLTTTQWDAVAGTSGGLAVGATYYISAVTAGLMSSTAPASAGQFVMQTVIGISPTIGLVLLAGPAQVGAASSVSGSGSANTITKYTGASTLGNSAITDNGTFVQFTNPVGVQNAPIGQNSLTVRSTSTTQTTVGWFEGAGALHVGNGGINEQIPIVVRGTTTFDTTSLPGYSAGIDLAVTSTRAAGANPLVNKGVAISVAGGDTNLAIDIAAGTCNFQDANFAAAVVASSTFSSTGTTTLGDSSHDTTVGRKLTINGNGSLATALQVNGDIVAGVSAASSTLGKIRINTQNGQDALQLGAQAAPSNPKYWSLYPSSSDLKLFEYNDGQNPGGSGNDRVFFRTGGGVTSLSYLQVSGTSGAKWSSGGGSPETVVVGSPGDLWSDTTNGALYLKVTGSATNTGWKAVTHA